MALHPKFPKSPYDILDPAIRWFSADKSLGDKKVGELLPPLVVEIRKKVRDWRLSGYDGASETSKTLLKWWFLTDHPITAATGETILFKYYFAQREAVETIIWLYEVIKARDKYELIRFDVSGAVSPAMFDETWTRYIIKMATGAGKTKVLSLILAWSYFHKTYESDSQLARNFLVVTPNIIVLDRIRTDFDSLKIFFEDPILPDNGYMGQNWRDDFQMTLHIQDEIGTVRKTGNIFLTNIHRVYEGATESASFDDTDTSDFFLGTKPTGATNDSKLDLGDIVRNVDELVVLNDEAHHIHDPRLAWFKAIEDMHNRLKMKGSQLSLQIDVTATPKHTNGSIFVQTVSDYPLVEAIHQNVVKHPVLPDPASRAKLQEHTSSNFTEKYKDYIHLGYLEWKKVYDEHIKLNKKSVLFVMTDDTINCDDVAEYLENTYSDLRGAVLVIHTKDNGDSSESNILPEQTLGRGLRRMYRDPDLAELVSVVGTDAFMDFVESIKSEGVELEHRKMGEGSGPKAPLVVEIDRENMKKDIEKMEI